MRFSRVAFFSEYWIYNVVIYSIAFYTEMWYFSKELSDSIGVITEPVINWAAPGAHIVPNISVRVCVENTSGYEVLNSLLLVLKSAWQPWWACWVMPFSSESHICQQLLIFSFSDHCEKHQGNQTWWHRPVIPGHERSTRGWWFGDQPGLYCDTLSQKLKRR